MTDVFGAALSGIGLAVLPYLLGDAVGKNGHASLKGLGLM
jgi:hypothetical protein